MSQMFQIRDLGTMDYLDALHVQTEAVERVKDHQERDTLLLVEHPPVLTLGAKFRAENLLLSPTDYEARGIHVHPTGRGGDVTYHGPGQLVIYPIFNVENHGRDLHLWLRNLEEVAIRTVGEFGLIGQRLKPHTGAWVGDLDKDPRKIAAIGIKMRSWVSFHGISINCNVDLTPFSWIVPCGIQKLGVTSLAAELDRDISPDDVKPAVIRAFESVLKVCRS